MSGKNQSSPLTSSPAPVRTAASRPATAHRRPPSACDPAPRLFEPEDEPFAGYLQYTPRGRRGSQRALIAKPSLIDNCLWRVGRCLLVAFERAGVRNVIIGIL